MINPITEWLKSYDTTNDGWSGRKLTAFAMVILIGWLHYKIVIPTDTKQCVDFAIIKEVIATDEIFVCVLLGLVTFQQLLSLKGSLPIGNTTSTETVIKKTTIEPVTPPPDEPNPPLDS